MAKKAVAKKGKGGGGKRVRGKAAEIVNGPFREGAPMEVNGLKVTGETGDGAAWVCDNGQGDSVHILKAE